MIALPPWPVTAAWIAAPVIASIPRWRFAAYLTIVAALIVQGGTVWLAIGRPDAAHEAAALVAFCALCAALRNPAWLEDALATSRITPRAVRAHHALFQIALGGLLIGLLVTDPGPPDRGAAWFGLTLALVCWAMAAALPRSLQARQASQRILILGGVCCLLGQLGLVLADAPQCGVLAGWFVLFAVLGLCGIGPMQAWLPAALAQAPPPLSILLAGALPALALRRIGGDASGGHELGFLAILLAGLHLIVTGIGRRTDDDAGAVAHAGALVLAGTILTGGEAGASLILAFIPLGGALMAASPGRQATGRWILFAMAGLPPFGLAGGLLQVLAMHHDTAWPRIGALLCALVFGVGAIVSAISLIARSGTGHDDPMATDRPYLAWALLAVSTIAGWGGWFWSGWLGLWRA